MRKTFRTIGVVAITLLLGGCFGNHARHGESDLLRVKSEQGDGRKKVILLVADSLMAQSIDRGVQNGLLPTFRYLIERGQYYSDVVSSFPTMSVTIDASIVTGEYPDGHRVPGLSWYSADERRIVNYGTGPMEAIDTGGKQVLTDFLSNLNALHLNKGVSTIYEDLAKQGLTSGSVNGMIYRGKTEHSLRMPGIIQLPFGFPAEIKTRGPEYFSFGDFSNPLEGIKQTSDGAVNKFGFNNRFALETIEYLVRNDKLPDFLYAYLPDLDQRLHKHGPSDLEGVRKLDEQLQSLLRAFGSPEEALKKAVIVIAGDSGMSSILPAGRDPIVDLPELLKEYDLLGAGESATGEQDIALAVNETMAYVYSLKPELSLREIAARLRSDSRIGLIAWKENDWIHSTRGAVAGEFRFRKGGERIDRYGQAWTWEGNPGVLDESRYPDGLRRLHSALNSHRGNYLTITSEPGYELVASNSPTHRGGGGHGSLHRAESLVPLIICGTDLKPRQHRLIDLKPYLLKLAGSKLTAKPSSDGPGAR
ncbi:alkaline phosphatase family protein [Cohnella cholangitidis]|uniref:Alkaline phosphatase family protein n=1 Tax=Cohnella cholangitidis TaxID=2598458 RepID=A0A7G5BVU2_9BACL|nr:alkaline phosphatase family protein [Cohnella cholangitidis]QMV41076.1 alkaline phosphatase family protein [Cohnella cholangitidis]